MASDTWFDILCLNNEADAFWTNISNPFSGDEELSIQYTRMLRATNPSYRYRLIKHVHNQEEILGT